MQWFTTYLGYAAGALLAILPIVNPLGAVPLVIAVASHLPEQERLRQIRRACIYTFVLMSSFLVAGSLVMSFFGISIPGMRIAGGMIVAFLGFGMLFPGADAGRGKVPPADEIRHDIAFTPLAMPGLSGPGTFAVVMSLSSQASARQGWDRIADFLGVATGILLVAVISWSVLRAAEKFNRILGVTGMLALTRLMGFLMICIGVQFIINGLAVVLGDPAMWEGLAKALRTQQG
ncbi:MAG: MarC family NAAT transporter [Steroidobacteraceae bacterium]|nr:MarC family NAAT transporter [Steroidobacteraceae bacterium]